MAQGLGLVLRALAAQGLARVGFEDPGSVASITATAAWAGLAAVPVPVDDHGVDVAALEVFGAGAVVLTPAHQWPTGGVLAPERRLALIDWAARGQAVIIEDDYDAEFRYDRDPVGAPQGLAPDRVVAWVPSANPWPRPAAGLDRQSAQTRPRHQCRRAGFGNPSPTDPRCLAAPVGQRRPISAWSHAVQVSWASPGYLLAGCGWFSVSSAG
jgi:hypothetical protein